MDYNVILLRSHMCAMKNEPQGLPPVLQMNMEQLARCLAPISQIVKELITLNLANFFLR